MGPRMFQMLGRMSSPPQLSQMCGPWGLPESDDPAPLFLPLGGPEAEFSFSGNCVTCDVVFTM